MLWHISTVQILHMILLYMNKCVVIAQTPVVCMQPLDVINEGEK